MSDKVVDSVVESAMALKEIAIENAKTQLMNELSPKITKLFDERLNESSKKVLSEQEEEEGGEEAEAEVDLDDLAKEIEQEEGESEGGSVEDKVEELEQKVDSIEVKVDDVEEEVAELKGDEPTEEGDDEEEVEIEDDSTEEEEKSDNSTEDDEEVEIEDDSLEESVDIDIKDNDVRINVDADDNNAYVDIVDDTAAPIESEYVDIEDDSLSDDDEIKENRRMTLRRKIRESGKATSSQLEHRVSVLKRALNRASKIIVNERAAMKKVENVLNETKLLNEKLVLVNRIFAKYDLNKDRKYRVLEAFDKASNSKESVIVYKTILEQLDKKGTVIKNSSTTPSKASKLQESMKKDDSKKVICEKVDPKVLLEAARPTGVLPPSKIVDADRMKKLAGIE